VAESTGEGVRPRVPDHVWLSTIFAATAVVLLTGVLLVRTGFDPSRLVRAAPSWTDPANTLPSLTVLPHEYEFDGQFFYRLAVAPFSNAASVAGVTFDLPALRGSRWGFGLAGYLLSAGQPALVPWSLLVVNAGCLVLLAVIGGGFARSSGRHALWGLLLPLWPGFAYTLTLDTAELLTSVFLMGSLLAARRRAFVWTAVLASAAAVTRETAVVGAVGLVVAGLVARARLSDDTDRRSANGLWVAGLVALSVFCLSQLGGWLLFGQLPLGSSTGNNAGLPLVGLFAALVDSTQPVSAGNALRLVSLLLVMWMMVAGAIVLRSSSAALAEKVTWVAAVAVVAVLNGNPLVNAPSLMRAATEAGLLTVVLLLGSRSRLLLPTAIAMGSVTVISIGTMIVRMPPL